MGRIKIGEPCGLTDGSYHNLSVGDIIRNVSSGIKAEINSYGHPVNCITETVIKDYKPSEWVLDEAWDADKDKLVKRKKADSSAAWYEKKKKEAPAAEPANEPKPEKIPNPGLVEEGEVSPEAKEEPEQGPVPENTEEVPDIPETLDPTQLRQCREAVELLRSYGFTVVAARRICYTIEL